MRKSIYFVWILIALISCKRSTEISSLPDYTSQAEAEFPYKVVDKSLKFISEDKTDSIVFVFESKTTYRLKNVVKRGNSDQNLNRLQRFCSVYAKAKDFSYEVSVSEPNQFNHRFDLYNVSTSISAPFLELGMLSAGDNLSEDQRHASLELFNVTYVDVLELYENGSFGNRYRPISKVLFCRSNGVIGFFHYDMQKWFYLKP